MAALRAGPCSPATAVPTSRSAGAAASASADLLPSCLSCRPLWQGSLSAAAADCREAGGHEWTGSFGAVSTGSWSGRTWYGHRTNRELLIVGRAGGSRPPAGARRPRVNSPRKPLEDNGPASKNGVLINGDIRAPVVRLLDEKQNMVGVVPLQEALSRSKEAELDLVMISPDADPPVVRIIDYSKFRYEQQKKKKDQQKKSLANRVELKELKMRYNIDKHDYDVRLRAALRFLRSGDKVKVICQFKGREFEFKDLAFELFQRFQQDTAEVGIVEAKMTLEGRSLSMVLAPDKVALLKSTTSKDKEKGKSAKTDSDSDGEEEDIEALNDIDDSDGDDDEPALDDENDSSTKEKETQVPST